MQPGEVNTVYLFNWSIVAPYLTLGEQVEDLGVHLTSNFKSLLHVSTSFQLHC